MTTSTTQPGQSLLADAMTEAELAEGVRCLAKALGWLDYHTFDSRRSEAGYPDRTMVRRGRLVFAELKRERAAATPAQEAWLSKLRKVGGPVEVYVWRPSSWLDGTIERCLR